MKKLDFITAYLHNGECWERHNTNRLTNPRKSQILALRYALELYATSGEQLIDWRLVRVDLGKTYTVIRHAKERKPHQRFTQNNDGSVTKKTIIHHQDRVTTETLEAENG